jgi:hypothetical protein
MDAGTLYRKLIDEMVKSCREGQGQIGRRRVRTGEWNRNAVPDSQEWADQHAFNMLLGKLSQEDREVLGTMLAQEFESGIHEALVILHEWGIQPFDQAVEGTPFHDFVGRLDGWEWPA